jgi:hypothetical protein
VKQVFRLWFVSLVLLTLIAGFAYIVVQQNYRQSANYPQITMAKEVAAQLNAGKKYTPAKTIDIAQEPVPFTIIYSEHGEVLASDARLDGLTPRLPNGVLNYTQQHGINKVTWEPKSGVRIAAVVVPFSRGFVLVGKSLYETELRETTLEEIVAVFWVVSNSIMLGVIAMITKKRKK